MFMSALGCVTESVCQPDPAESPYITHIYICTHTHEHELPMPVNMLSIVCKICWVLAQRERERVYWAFMKWIRYFNYLWYLYNIYS